MWRSFVFGFQNVIYKGMCWVIGDGKLISFWIDIWMNNFALTEAALIAVDGDWLSKKAGEYWIPGVGWNIDVLKPILPQSTLLQLAAIAIGGFNGVLDRMAWQGTTDGSLSVTSAYSLITESNIHDPYMGNLFSRAWKICVPERIRMFLWLVLWRRILTNKKRCRRKFASDDRRPVCLNQA